MPQGTLLYHGRMVDDIPNLPEWLAFDFEHANIFASELSPDPGYVLTFAAKRPLKLVYFDGSSAAKLRDGGLDSQDILIDRKVHLGGTMKDDIVRISRLCVWGKPLGVDGFVRMEYHL